jgi:hypothetical protein
VEAAANGVVGNEDVGGVFPIQYVLFPVPAQIPCEYFVLAQYLNLAEE